MDKITELSKELNISILESEEYRNYIFARNSLKSNEGLFNKVMEFKRYYEDVMKYTDGNPFDDILRLYYENDELLHNSVVNEYLRAESALSKLMRKVITRVTDGIHFEE
ncbi:Control of competence regulator ComK, YlbF/YmcA [Lachnospiraceae bacterium NE2001]|nr:Control of competence regulator ComK, YlbF/YmcA [Lachnospiraceae bacterium NE2001]